LEMFRNWSIVIHRLRRFTRQSSPQIQLRARG